jgi:hypothetical protein
MYKSLALTILALCMIQLLLFIVGGWVVGVSGAQIAVRGLQNDNLLLGLALLLLPASVLMLGVLAFLGLFDQNTPGVILTSLALIQLLPYIFYLLFTNTISSGSAYSAMLNPMNLLQAPFWVGAVLAIITLFSTLFYIQQRPETE